MEDEKDERNRQRRIQEKDDAYNGEEEEPGERGRKKNVRERKRENKKKRKRYR